MHDKSEETSLPLSLFLLTCRIDDNYVIKIADFGLSEDIYTKLYFRQPSHSTVRLPIKWLAIESLQEGIFTEKTDVVKNNFEMC